MISYIEVILINFRGQTILAREFVIREGMNKFSLKLTDVNDGFYYIEIKDETKRYFSKIIINKE